MSAIEIILAIVATVGAGSSGLFAWLSKKSQSEHRLLSASESAKQEQQVQFYAQVLAECKDLRNGNQELQKQVLTLQNEVHKLREQLEFYEQNHLANESRDMLESIFNDFLQRPAWIHDLSANKWYLNDAYCKMFSIKRKTFWTPINIFGRYDAADAVKYSSNDMQVVEAGTTIEFTERIRVRIMEPRCDEFITAKFQKTPLIINSRPYVAGKMLEQVQE